MVHVEVRRYASLERYHPPLKAGEPLPVELAGKTTVAQLLGILKIPQKAVFLIFINGLVRPLNQVLADGDRVALFPPIGGG